MGTEPLWVTAPSARPLALGSQTGPEGAQPGRVTVHPGHGPGSCRPLLRATLAPTAGSSLKAGRRDRVQGHQLRALEVSLPAAPRQPRPSGRGRDTTLVPAPVHLGRPPPAPWPVWVWPEAGLTPSPSECRAPSAPTRSRERRPLQEGRACGFVSSGDEGRLQVSLTWGPWRAPAEHRLCTDSSRPGGWAADSWIPLPPPPAFSPSQACAPPSCRQGPAPPSGPLSFPGGLALRLSQGHVPSLLASQGLPGSGRPSLSLDHLASSWAPAGALPPRPPPSRDQRAPTSDP